MFQGISLFLVFLHHFVLTKLDASSMGVKMQVFLHHFVLTKLAASSIWIKMQVFLHHFVLTKLSASSKRVKMQGSFISSINSMELCLFRPNEHLSTR